MSTVNIPHEDSKKRKDWQMHEFKFKNLDCAIRPENEFSNTENSYMKIEIKRSEKEQ